MQVRAWLGEIRRVDRMQGQEQQQGVVKKQRELDREAVRFWPPSQWYASTAQEFTACTRPPATPGRPLRPRAAAAPPPSVCCRCCRCRCCRCRCCRCCCRCCCALTWTCWLPWLQAEGSGGASLMRHSRAAVARLLPARSAPRKQQGTVPPGLREGRPRRCPALTLCARPTCSHIHGVVDS